jgi:ubiquitin-protein ligase
MTSPRLRRLDSDYQRMMTSFSGHPAIRLEPVGPTPPDRYRVIFSVPGLRISDDGIISRVEQHLVEIYLPAEYPREKPYCTTANPVFHPNFGSYICIADFWSPGQSLVDVVVQIGDMLQYKLFNTQSPLNALAAKWASENLSRLPIGSVELLPQVPEISLGVLRERSAPASAVTGGVRYDD